MEMRGIPGRLEMGNQGEGSLNKPESTVLNSQPTMTQGTRLSMTYTIQLGVSLRNATFLRATIINREISHIAPFTILNFWRQETKWMSSWVEKLWRSER
jgi:hypothetical protein